MSSKAYVVANPASYLCMACGWTMTQAPLDLTRGTVVVTCQNPKCSGYKVEIKLPVPTILGTTA